MEKVKGSLDREDDFNGGPVNPHWSPPRKNQMRIKDGDHEDLRHALAHLWCAIDELIDAQPNEDQRTGARAHLTDCEAQIFTDDELSDEGEEDGPSTVPQGKEGQEGQGERR